MAKRKKARLTAAQRWDLNEEYRRICGLVPQKIPRPPEPEPKPKKPKRRKRRKPKPKPKPKPEPKPKPKPRKPNRRPVLATKEPVVRPRPSGVTSRWWQWVRVAYDVSSEKDLALKLHKWLGILDDEPTFEEAIPSKKEIQRIELQEGLEVDLVKCEEYLTKKLTSVFCQLLTIVPPDALYTCVQETLVSYLWHTFGEHTPKAVRRKDFPPPLFKLEGFPTGGDALRNEDLEAVLKRQVEHSKLQAIFKTLERKEQKMLQPNLTERNEDLVAGLRRQVEHSKLQEIVKTLERKGHKMIQLNLAEGTTEGTTESATGGTTESAIEHTHIRTSISAANCYSECNRKWFLRYRETPDIVQEPKKALYIGTAVHEVLEIWFQKPEAEKNMEDLYPLACECLTRAIEELPCPTHLKENLPTPAEEAVVYVCARAAIEALPKGVKFLAFEQKIRVGDYFTGILDAVIEVGGKQMIVDYKCLSTYEDLTKVSMDPQLRMYEAIAPLLKDADGKSIIDMDRFIGTAKLVLKKPTKKFGAKGESNPVAFYERAALEPQFVFVKADRKLAETYLNTHKILNKKVNSSVNREDFPCNRLACTNVYGKCEYFDICNPPLEGSGFDLRGEDIQSLADVIAGYEPDEILF